MWVFAQPDPVSLNAGLRDEGLARARELGHEVVVSDLYAMKWKATVDRDDYGDGYESDPVTVASQRAFADGTLSADVLAEQSKLDWADALVLQFPLWWFGPPAILKGWIDRVFVKGYAYGVRDPHDPRRTLRYGEGNLVGKRAMVITTAGSPAAALGPRGINGQVDEVLFPLLHGTLWYTGMTVLPPVVIPGADRIDAEHYRQAAQLVRDRVATLDRTEPIRYRHQAGGDYDPDFVLHPHVAPGASGIAVHRVTG
ncbi:MAG TPA: NAD(P)H-dependent oxidoreductase [Pseudonocardiaceae bacterium]|nr:NAD(P)H-dependent oxidoreductase [Pseudonocardiaceae bacterium]